MMDMAPETPLSVQIAAALDWWRDAGVDSDFSDEPRDWLPSAISADVAAEVINAPPVAPVVAPVCVPVIHIGGAQSDWPTTLAGFAPWWLAEPSLDDGQTSGRVPPRGMINAPLMVLVAEPEAQDTGRLLSGPQGRLLDGMLAALGISPDQAYVASALPRHTPMADWTGLTAAGLGRILVHHIMLAAPKRLIVFGGNVLPLLGNDLPNSSADLPGFNHEGISVPILSAMELAALLARPRTKAKLWHRLLDWAD